MVGLLVAAAMPVCAQATLDFRKQAELARPGLASVIDARLVVLAEQAARQANAPSRLVATEAERAMTDLSLVQRAPNGDVAVRIHSKDPSALAEPLKALGATHVFVVADAYLIDCYVPVNRLADLADLVPSGLKSATAQARPMSMGGVVTSQADWIMEAERVRRTLPVGYDGSGVRIGCLSDSYGTGTIPPANYPGGGFYEGDDVPASVQILQDLAPGAGTDEGRAMIELMYDLAPGAEYLFATAAISEPSFAQNIRNLASEDIGRANVIVDDVVYFAEPYFQNSLVGRAINDVVNFNNVTYFSAAGNQATQAYERVNPGTAADGTLGGTFLDMNPGSGVDARQTFTVPPGGTLTLVVQWDDPFYTANGVDTDLDLYLVEGPSNLVVPPVITDNIANQQPLEIISFTNTAPNTRLINLMIQRFVGPSPGRVKYIQYGSTPITQYNTNSPTIVSHGAAERGCAVGAINFFEQHVPASFTSMGPSTILFNDNGTRLGAPQVRQTPLISAIQGTNTTFFGSDYEQDGFPNFFGTSAAAPHAAAVAALVLERNPGFTRDQVISTLINACDSSINGAGFDNLTGHGSLNAYRAVFGLPVPGSAPQADISDPNGALPNFAEIRSTGNGQIRVTTGNGPQVGNHHVTMDSHFTFFVDADGILQQSQPSLNEMIMRFNFAGQTNVQLSFLQREWGDEDHPMPSTFTGSANCDGVAYSVDGGSTWKRIVSLTGLESQNTYQTKNFNLTQIAAGYGDTLGADVRVKFQQFDNADIGDQVYNDGMAFDNIAVASVPLPPTPTPSPTPTPTPTPTSTPAPTPTPTPTPLPTNPSVTNAGLAVNIQNSSASLPSFVAYFVRFGNTFVYQGDSGWQSASDYDVTFQNWPYGTLPLMLQAYRGNPAGGVAGIIPIGATTLSNGTITRTVQASGAPNPFVSTAGLGVNITSPSSQPSFVAYFVRFGNTFVYQGDSGWSNSTAYDVTFQNWPYSTLPLRLQAYRGNPSGGVAGITPIGSTTMVGGTITKAAQ